MTLQAAEHLGPYGIVEPVGAGGMWEVYRDKDTRSKRDVFVKVVNRARTLRAMLDCRL